MKTQYSWGTKVACVGIAAWFVVVVVLALTVPFRQPTTSGSNAQAQP